MNKYSSSKIYKIISPSNPDNVYFGSTIQKLCMRFAKHKSNYRKFIKKEFHYMSCFEILCFDDSIIVLVENVNVQNKEELFSIETKYILENNCVNKTLPKRNKQEYMEETKEKRLAIQKEWYKKNAEKAKQYHRTRTANKNKLKPELICEKCNYKTIYESYYQRHLNSKKHKI
jgi:hypothetical protein